MKAVRCPVCELDCAPGDYGNTVVIATPIHFNRSVGEFTALLTANRSDLCMGHQKTCSGSEMPGDVVNYDD